MKYSFFNAITPFHKPTVIFMFKIAGTFLLASILGLKTYASPGVTNFQAHITKPDGSNLESNSVNFTFKYLNAAGTCTLYVETYIGLNMVGSGGNVSIQLGSGAPSFPVAGVSLNDILSNSIANIMNCVEGGNYTPILLTEKRKFVVEFSYAGSNGSQSLPATEIVSVPYAMYAGVAGNSDRLGGLTSGDFTKVADVATCGLGQYLTFDGTSFSCTSPGVPVSFTGSLSGDVTGTQNATVLSRIRGTSVSAAVPTSGEFLGFDGTTWKPMAIIGASGTVTQVSSANLYLSVASSSSAPVLTVNVGSTTNTLAAGDDARIVGAWPAAGALSGDVTGTLSATSVSFVGGRTAAQISTSVGQTLAAVSSADPATLVRRSGDGSASFNLVGATSVSSRSYLFYDNTLNEKITVLAPNALSSGDYTLTLPAHAGTNGYVLSTNGTGVTSWIPATSGTVTSVGAISPILSSGGNTPNISLPPADTATDGYLSSTDWTTFANKQNTLARATSSVDGYLASSDFSFFAGKVSSQWVTNASGDIHRVSGNVGIGTNSPTTEFMVVGTHGAGSTLNTSGAGTRMFFYPLKSAFRAGFVSAAQWDNSMIGNYSTATGYNTSASGDYSSAMGYNTKAGNWYSLASGWSTNASGQTSTALGAFTTASGTTSIAMGGSSTASGTISTAMGGSTIASGDYSTAMGGSTIASGNYSTAIGVNTTSESYGQTTIGSHNLPKGAENPSSWITTDPLFVIGNGTGSGASRSNAMMVLKNGQTGFGRTPSYAVDVSGDVNVTGNFKINGTNIGGGTTVVNINGTPYTITSGDSSTAYYYSHNANGVINLPSLASVSNGFNVTITREVAKTLTITPNGSDRFPGGVSSIEMQRKNLQSITITKLGSTWKLTNQTEECTVGQDCWTADSTGGMSQIYVGIYNGRQYFTTPGGCTNSATPTCAGGLDNPNQAWADNSGTTAYNINAVATDSFTDGAAQSNYLATNYTDTEAAEFCESMNYAGYTDWYLPSIRELSFLYQQGQHISGFQWSGVYWSSTEASNTHAWLFYFLEGYAAPVNKIMNYQRRCVRRF